MTDKKGVDYPTKTVKVVVGIAETGTGEPGANGNQKTRSATTGGNSGIPSTTTYYALFYDRTFENYSNGQYTYYDVYYEKVVSVDTPPTPLQTDGGLRYKPSKTANVNYLSKSFVASKYSVTRATDVQSGSSPKSYGWSPTKGAKKWGDDPYAVVPSNSKESTSGSDGGGNNGGSGGGTDSNTDASAPDGPKIPGWNKSRKTYWNAPLIKYASGAYIPVDIQSPSYGVAITDSSAPRSRADILGAGTYDTRISRKGFFRQYTKYQNDWRASNYTKSDNSTDPANWDPGYSNADSVLETGKKYGFRFHYNPATLSFSVGYNGDVNPGLVLGMQTRAMPITNPEGATPTVALTLYLNRIEDVSLIHRKGKSWQLDPRIGSIYSGKVTPADLQGIATKGTMYDLEQLFLVCLGRKFKTDLRGTTSDLGMIFGVPLELRLSEFMHYRGRISNLSYQHTSFTANMIPLFTEVTVTFERFPDATSFSNTPTTNGPGDAGRRPGKGNGKYDDTPASGGSR